MLHILVADGQKKIEHTLRGACILQKKLQLGVLGFKLSTVASKIDVQLGNSIFMEYLSTDAL